VFYKLFVAAFATWQTLAVMIEKALSSKPKTFTIWLYRTLLTLDLKYR
jgi:hypothetical protein